MRAYEFIREDDVPQPGPSSGRPKELSPDALSNQKNLTLRQIFKNVQDIPYHKDVVKDYDKKDMSWNVTPKTIEYAKYFKDNPESVKNIPPIIAIDGKLDDGAHRIAAINLLQKRMDRNNPYWKNVKLPTVLAKSADVKSGGGSGGVGAADTRDMQMGADLDPKAMMMRNQR